MESLRHLSVPLSDGVPAGALRKPQAGVVGTRGQHTGHLSGTGRGRRSLRRLCHCRLCRLPKSVSKGGLQTLPAPGRPGRLRCRLLCCRLCRYPGRFLLRRQPALLLLHCSPELQQLLLLRCQCHRSSHANLMLAHPFCKRLLCSQLWFYTSAILASAAASSHASRMRWSATRGESLSRPGSGMLRQWSGSANCSTICLGSARVVRRRRPIPGCDVCGGRIAPKRLGLRVESGPWRRGTHAVPFGRRCSVRCSWRVMRISACK
mmetsp:Transcript_1303/g.3900  ORF Transcript_1303/g.3900 Transcript_1303/m.3900 type:complete len:263 (-) Transcript_1303:362-1150(-)